MTTFWVGVASRDHAMKGVKGGFCQLSHGKSSPVERLKPGDRIMAVSQADKEPVDITNMPLTRAVELIRGPKGSRSSS